MSSVAERSFDFVVDVLLYPARVPPKTLTRLSSTISIAVLLTVVILVLPPVKDRIFCEIEIFRRGSQLHSEAIRNWCDFVFIGSQVIIAIAVGGFVFTDSVARWVRQRSQTVQLRLEEITEALQTRTELTERQKAIVELQDKISNIRRDLTLKTLWPKARAVSHVIDEMYALLVPTTPTVNFVFNNLFHIPFPFNRIPGLRDNKLIILLGMRYGLAFPGGLYGGIAYLFFLIMVSAASLKTYFDYAPHCT
jgi:hypothetical protein